MKLIRISVLTLLIAATTALAGPGDPSEPAVPVIEVPGTPAPGVVAPPAFAQLLLFSDRVLEIQVTRTSAGTEEWIEARVLACLYGSEIDLPKQIRLAVPIGVSELGVQKLGTRIGERLLLLLRREDRGYVLTSGNAYSVAGAGRLAYLTTADLTFRRFEELKVAAWRALFLRKNLERTPWAKQGPLLAKALRAKPLTSEAALTWYSHRTTGWPSGDMSLGPEIKQKLAPLPEVEDALLDLIPPREDRLSTLAGAAVRILATRGPEAWVPRLSDPERGEAVFLLLQELATGYHPEFERPLAASLRNGAGALDPIVRYLCAGLLYRTGNGSRLQAILGIQLGEGAQRLKAFQHARVWPPLAYLSELAGEELADETAARRFIDRVERRR